MFWMVLAFIIGGVMYACLYVSGGESREEERRERRR
jgi:Flp pilus assembly protein TadB